MGVNYSHLCSVANGRRPWTPDLREKAMAVLGEVPGQGVVYREGGRVSGSESNYIREQAREVGLSMGELADRVGISLSYLSQAARGERRFGPQVQARVEAELQAPVRVEAARRSTVDPQALWERMDAHGISQNEVARRAGISKALLSQVMNGQRTPPGTCCGGCTRFCSLRLRRSWWLRGIEGHGLEEGAGAAASWSRAPAGRAATRFGPAAGCPGAPRWSSPTAPVTTAGARCRLPTWWTSGATVPF